MFSIITPTYKRKESLMRAITSVREQACTSWEMIIVNDSPDDASYHDIEKELDDSRITYLVNSENRGVNFSRNRALDHISKDSKWVIFLDDDDYLSPTSLTELSTLVEKHHNETWIMTNRAYKEGKKITHAPCSDTHYSYAWDYLISKCITGDATHIIKSSAVQTLRFSAVIRQGDEWVFFYQLGLKSRIFYHDHNTTLTDGYDAHSGLNFRKRPRDEQLKTLKLLWKEGSDLHLTKHPTFVLYLGMRLLRSML